MVQRACARARALIPPTVPARCPVSGSTAVEKLCIVGDYQVWRCPESSTDFVWPMPSEAELVEFYSRAEWFNGGEKGGYLDYDAQTEPSLAHVTALLERFPNSGQGLSVLDVGCGYGSHLKLAADRGWRSFGIEPSSHARGVALQRHGSSLQVVERPEHLLPQRFDLVLMLDVLEHLRDPYKLFFTLFGKGAIGADTLVVVSTPNARSRDAVLDPAAWTYRHPPSHLVFYSAKSLDAVLRRLMFVDVQITGAVPTRAEHAPAFADEAASINEALVSFQALLAEARGSVFTEFMHERYVPGGFWKLTEYEHIPRYSFAAQYAVGARVLDFGCGTGYGSASLARVASSVVGLDISREAIDWARTVHRQPGLEFLERADLGAGLPSSSFDLVTCFEMIEHVDFETQVQTVESLARLLSPAGRLIISTPDPRYTAPYGENPYHIREMTEAEFLELLRPHFKHVKMLRQWVRPSVLIGEESIPDGAVTTLFGALDESGGFDSLVGFVAICSQKEFPTPPYFCDFDTSVDFNLATLYSEQRRDHLQLKTIELGYLAPEVKALNQILSDTRAWVAELTEIRERLEQRCSELEERANRHPLLALSHAMWRTLRGWRKPR